MPIRILLADDHRLVRTALAGVLNAVSEFEIIGEAEDGQEAVEKAMEISPDVVLMDITMPKLNGLEATRQIKDRCPDVQVIGVSMHDSEEMRERMLAAGAAEFMPKGSDLDLLIRAIREVAAT